MKWRHLEEWQYSDFFRGEHWNLVGHLTENPTIAMLESAMLVRTKLHHEGGIVCYVRDDENGESTSEDVLRHTAKAVLFDRDMSPLKF